MSKERKGRGSRAGLTRVLVGIGASRPSGDGNIGLMDGGDVSSRCATGLNLIFSCLLGSGGGEGGWASTSVVPPVLACFAAERIVHGAPEALEKCLPGRLSPCASEAERIVHRAPSEAERS